MPACRRNDRDLPSWSCEFDSRHPLHSESPRQRAFVAMLSCASIRAVELGPLRGPLVLGPPTNPLSPSFRRCFGSFNWPPAGTTSWPLTCIPCHLIDPENANRSGSDNTRRIPLIVCAGEPYITGLKCSIEQRTSGNNAAAMSASVVQPAMGQQAVLVRPSRELSLKAQPIDAATRAGCSAGGARSAARLPDPSPGTATRSPQRCGSRYVVVWTTAARSDVYSSARLGA